MDHKIITRFAPSPTGHLHLGHAWSARLNYEFAQNNGGRFLLRIEDIDTERCKPEFERAIYEDLSWLGLNWQTPVRRQSDHRDDYRQALDILVRKSLLYPCFCSRRDIRREIAESDRAPHSQEGPRYPGTCRHLSEDEAQARMTGGAPYALRLDMAKALALVGDQTLTWTDLEAGEQTASPELMGDVVLARKDIATSYHLAVVVDDNSQNISHVIRGRDLFHAAHIHRLLQYLLGYQTPTYLHHDLLTGDDGQRYAKRDNAKTLRLMRAEGYDPQGLIPSPLSASQ